MALQQSVEVVVTGLGYEVVDVERSAGGLLRVTIDWPWAPGSAGERTVTVEDCETVTRQLQFALEVDNVDYRRLEVSSPGIDRPLRRQQDFERFAGQVVDITLKAPMGAAAQGQVAANRKKFRGKLERAIASSGTDAEMPAAAWRIVWQDEPEAKPGARVSRKRAPAASHALDFTLDEIRDARLAPIVDFKGRSADADADAGVSAQNHSPTTTTP